MYIIQSHILWSLELVYSKIYFQFILKTEIHETKHIHIMLFISLKIIKVINNIIH